MELGISKIMYRVEELTYVKICYNLKRLLWHIMRGGFGLKKYSLGLFPKGIMMLLILAIVVVCSEKVGASSEMKAEESQNCIPQRLVIESLGIDQEIEASDNNEVINPSSAWVVTWWTGGGCPSSTPESDENLTTFLFGHATNNLDQKIVFDDLDLIQAEDKIIVVTDIGSFEYIAEEVFVVDKADFSTDDRVTANQAGRLLLISCWTEDEYNQGSANFNVVVVANLKSFLKN